MTIETDMMLRLRIEAFYADYVHCIDDDRLEDWPDFFTADGVYKIVTRENFELGLPAGVIYCDGRGMLDDRIAAMRTANIYEPHVYRHMISAVKVLDSDGRTHRTQTGFTVARAMHDGDLTLFNSGKYLDTLVEVDGGFKFKERIVVLDSRRVDTLLVVPI